MKWTRPIALSLVTALVFVACSSTPDETPTEEPQADPVHLRLLAFNDFHGSIEGPNGTVLVDGEEIDAGGAAYLAAHIDAERGEADHTTVVAAGDLIGASPLVSALFHDEPTIEIMDKLGLDIASVGNHEFDQGVDELLRIDEGGCHAEEGCREGHEFAGAQFRYLAANVRYRDTDETILPPYEIREYGDLKVAYVGMTLENTPQVVVPSAVEDVAFFNEVETVEKYMPRFEEKGVDSVVVVVHEGAAPTGEPTDIGDCADVEGRAIDMGHEMPEEVSVIVSGHSHLAYICEVGDRLVTQAGSSGRIVTVIDLHVDPVTGDIVEQSARQRAVTPDIEADDNIAGLVAEYVELADSRANRIVGRITDDLPRGARRGAGESPIGRLIADAQLAATADESDAQIAFMNPGGIRDALHYEDDAHDEDGVVTYAHLHTIQPFNNVLTTMTLTGEEIHGLLEQQWREEERPHLLAVSSGFSYEWDSDKPVGERIDPDSIELDGRPLRMDADYRITVNNFMADGGDGFSILTEGRDRVTGVIDLDALVDYIETNSPIDPPEDVRVRQVE